MNQNIRSESRNRRAAGTGVLPKRTWRAAAAALTLALGSTSCRVPAPTVQQGLSYGFHTPTQAFESFRTAVQGNLLDEEFRCFARQWRAQTQIKSLTSYDLAREEILAKIPQLRWALYRAEEPEIVIQWERDAVLQSRIPGPLWTKDRWLVLRMHREGYWDAWTEAVPEKPTEGMTFKDPWAAGVLEYNERYDVFRVNIDDFSIETGDTAHQAIIAAKGGWQWKILEFSVGDEPVTPDLFDAKARRSLAID